MASISRRSFVAALGAAAVETRFGAALAAAARTRRWSKAGLAAFRNEARDLGVRGLVVNSDGATIISAGDVATPLRIASIRKSFVSALYGIAAADGAVDLNARIGGCPL